MPIDPGLQTPENYMTPAQLQAQREYAKFLMEQSHGEVRSPAQGMANVARALMGGWESGRADSNEKQGRAQYAMQVANALKNPEGGVSGAVGAITSPWATPESNRMLTEALVPKMIQGPNGTYLVNPMGGGQPRFIMPGVGKGKMKVGDTEFDTQHQFNPDTGKWETQAMVPPMQGGGGGGPPQAPPNAAPQAPPGSAPGTSTGMPMVPPPAPPRPGEPMVGEPALPRERVAQGHNSVKDWTDFSAQNKVDLAARVKTAEEVAKQYVIKGEHIEKRSADAQAELSQMQLLKKVMANPQYMSGLLSNEVGALDQIGKMFGISSGETASLQQLAKKLSAGGSLEQVREMGELGAVRIPEMKMVEKSNYDPNNTVEANMAVVELRERALQRSIEIADMKNKYAQTGNIFGKPGRGTGSIDANFDQQIRDYYRDKPMITAEEMKRYDALATRPAGKEGIGAPIAGASAPGTSQRKTSTGVTWSME